MGPRELAGRPRTAPSWTSPSDCRLRFLSCLPFQSGNLAPLSLTPGPWPTGPQAHRPLSSATQGRCPHRPSPWLLLWGGTCSAFLLEGQVNVQGSKAVLPFLGPWSTALLSREGTEGVKDREGEPRGLPEARGRRNPQARHLLQDQPWLPGQEAVGPRQPHWGLTGSQPPRSRIPSMEQ